VVESWITPELDEAHIVLRPNRSWSWRANVGLVATLAVISTAIGIAFMFQGMWLILPFNLLEVGIVYLCLRYLLRRTRQQEVITFTDDEVRVACGAAEPETVTTFDRHWTQIHVVPGRYRERRRIAIRSRAQQQDIGSFLNEEDQKRLVQELRHLVHLFSTPAHRRQALFASDGQEHSATP
jgi:uncharacterized membrane protein